MVTIYFIYVKMPCLLNIYVYIYIYIFITYSKYTTKKLRDKQLRRKKGKNANISWCNASDTIIVYNRNMFVTLSSRQCQQGYLQFHLWRNQEDYCSWAHGQLIYILDEYYTANMDPFDKQFYGRVSGWISIEVCPCSEYGDVWVAKCLILIFGGKSIRHVTLRSWFRVPTMVSQSNFSRTTLQYSKLDTAREWLTMLNFTQNIYWVM